MPLTAVHEKVTVPALTVAPFAGESFEEVAGAVQAVGQVPALPTVTWCEATVVKVAPLRRPPDVTVFVPAVLKRKVVTQPSSAQLPSMVAG